MALSFILPFKLADIYNV